ncbi:MAG: methionyl-tRNA formyltransferase [Velocimicrobium sp.]
MRIIFMGTPDFSVPTLETLIKSEHEIIGVVTQPDKPKGRSKAVKLTPIKEKALEYNIPVYQPIKVRGEGFLATLKELNPDVIIVIAFGQILPKALLEIPQYGCINIHASLLPKLRGAAPIQWAVINGEVKTGVTTMQMDAGVDTGDMLLKKEIILEKKETGGSLHDKLSQMGGALILETLQLAKEGKLSPKKQEDSLSNYAKMLDKNLGKIDFSKSADEIERLIRGLNPWPSAYTMLDGKTLKIWDADVVEGKLGALIGEITEVRKDCFVVQTGNGALTIKELQLEGKKRMTIDAFLRGYTITVGTVL